MGSLVLKTCYQQTQHAPLKVADHLPAHPSHLSLSLTLWYPRTVQLEAGPIMLLGSNGGLSIAVLPRQRYTINYHLESIDEKVKVDSVKHDSHRHGLRYSPPPTRCSTLQFHLSGITSATFFPVGGASLTFRPCSPGHTTVWIVSK